jgi:hypothetical protein
MQSRRIEVIDVAELQCLGDKAFDFPRLDVETASQFLFTFVHRLAPSFGLSDSGPPEMLAAARRAAV